MKPHVSQQKTAALTLVEVLVVVFVLFVLVALLLPATSHRAPSMRFRCTQNLKQVGLAYNVWAGDHNGKFPMQVSVTNGGTMELNNGSNALADFLVMSNELNSPKVLHCPADIDRATATNFITGFSAKNISYFVGMDADKGHPQLFLSGDDNFAIAGVIVKSGLLELSTNAPITWAESFHDLCGNIGFADGRVEMVSLQSLQKVVQNTGLTTNRLAIP
jgi:competence protein ComGC